jgi:hypothetical protein
LVSSGNKRSRPNSLVTVVGSSQVVAGRHLKGDGRLILHFKVSFQKNHNVLQAAFNVRVVGRNVKVQQGQKILRVCEGNLGNVQLEKVSSNQVLFESHFGSD